MTKILFIHNTVMWYRIPFFRALSDIYSVEFLFNHMNVSKSVYGVETPNEIEGMDGVNYQLMSNYLGIAWGLLRKAWGDYDILVGGSWDSIPEILESVYYLTVAWLRRKPIILWREDWDWKDNSLKSKLLKQLKKLFIRTSSAMLVPGIKHREYFQSLGADTEKIFLMPNVSGISASANDNDNAEKIRHRLSLGDKKVILFVGRLTKRKGLGYLIKALNQLKTQNLVLLVLGDGECRAGLEKLSHELGITDKILFIGQIDNNQLPAYYILADLCVIPSITYIMADPAPLVVNEAMSFKNPVITTDAVGCAPDFIHNGKNGFIVPEKDASALAQNMDKILEDDNLAHKMGEESYKIIQERFRYVNMVNGFEGAVGYSLKKE